MLTCSILACLLFFWGGCQLRKVCPFPEDMDFEEISPLSENLTVDIYIDASYSMVGFVALGNSYYVRMLQLLERSFIAGWPKGTRNFHKFGTSISEISREQAKEAAFERFYRDPNFCAETRIESVIDSAKEGNLNIIITDLFQMDADVNLLIERLNQKFLSKKVSVGVLGIKSQFNGKVWDVGLQSLNFSYSTDGRDPGEFRPFYLLMIGNYYDIAHFYKMMNYNGLDSFPEKNFLILSPQLVERLATFENSKIKQRKVKEIRGILQNSRVCRHFKQFMINNGSSEHYFESTIEMPFLDHMPDFNPQRITTEVTAWQWLNDPKIPTGNNGKAKKLDSKGELIFSEEALRAFIIKDVSISGKQLKLKVEIDPGNFPGDGKYCFKIMFSSLSDSCSFPKWISEWDMDQNLIYQWNENRGDFNGSTTLNLKNFLNNIWQIIYQNHKPKIAKLYCYIEKRGSVKNLMKEE